jgi:alkylation response protein AidB-like acyl-CoA dehydrogenase
MRFDLSPELAALQARARSVAATTVRPVAAEIDRTAVVPPPVTAAIEALAIRGADALASVLMIEELAVASASAAAWGGLGVAGPAAGLAGLRGVPRVTDPDRRQHLAMAAVCLGIGRAALEEALDAARARGDRPAGEPGAPPHWALADAATEVDAARLLVQASAAGQGLPAPAVLACAATAARHAVDAALRIVGAEGFAAGGTLERCVRDARTACLIVGTEDGVRQAAADALLA